MHVSVWCLRHLPCNHSGCCIPPLCHLQMLRDCLLSISRLSSGYKQHARHAIPEIRSCCHLCGKRKGNAPSPGLHILGLKERNKVLAEDSNIIPSLRLPRTPPTPLVRTHDKFGLVCTIDNGPLSFTAVTSFTRQVPCCVPRPN